MKSPVGTMQRSKGCSVMEVSRLARKSMPALSGVSYLGSAWWERLTISIFMEILLFGIGNKITEKRLHTSIFYGKSAGCIVFYRIFAFPLPYGSGQKEV